MHINLRREEDKIKSLFYQEIARDFRSGDIREYTRECMKRYDIGRFEKQGQRLSKSCALEEALMQIAEEFRAFCEKNASKREKRKYNLQALKTIRRCCRGTAEFVLSYYRFYTNAKKGAINFNIDYQEESSSEEF